MFSNGVKSKFMEKKFPHCHFLHHGVHEFMQGLNQCQRDKNPWAAWLWYKLSSSSSSSLLVKPPAEMVLIYIESFRVPVY
jgi:hypothetical protein